MTTLRIQHNSMQFSDNRDQHAHDAKAVFDRAAEREVAFVSGTESGNAADNHDLRDFLIREAHAHGFFIRAHKFGEWVAVNRDLVQVEDSGFRGPYIQGTHGLNASEGAHSPRGITYASGTLKAEDVGLVTVGSAHFLTNRSEEVSGSNAPLIKGVGEFGHEFGGGRKLVFMDADANDNDLRNDVFDGQPFTTARDELDRALATHGRDKKHGTAIDFIASYDSDKRVSAVSYHVLDDSDLKLATDHFLLEATFEVESLRHRG
jgi:hypothetical protein